MHREPVTSAGSGSRSPPPAARRPCRSGACYAQSAAKSSTSCFACPLSQAGSPDVSASCRQHRNILGDRADSAEASQPPCSRFGWTSVPAAGLPDFGQICLELDRDGVDIGQIRPRLSRDRPQLVQNRLTATNLGPISWNVDQHWPRIGQIWPELGRTQHFESELGQSRPAFSWNRPKVAQRRPTFP